MAILHMSNIKETLRPTYELFRFVLFCFVNFLAQNWIVLNNQGIPILRTNSMGNSVLKIIWNYENTIWCVEITDTQASYTYWFPWGNHHLMLNESKNWYSLLSLKSYNSVRTNLFGSFSSISSYYGLKNFHQTLKFSRKRKTTNIFRAGLWFSDFWKCWFHEGT